MRCLRFIYVFLAVFLISAMIGGVYADEYADTVDVFKKSPEVQPFFKNAYGYAVFPTIGKGGMGIGGAFGTGKIYQGGKTNRL